MLTAGLRNWRYELTLCPFKELTQKLSLQAINNTKKISKLQGKVSAGQQAIVTAQTQLEERGVDTASLQQRMEAMRCQMSGEVHSLQQELCEAWRKHKVFPAQ